MKNDLVARLRQQAYDKSASGLDSELYVEAADALAASQSRTRELEAGRQSDRQLMKFYAVETRDDLIDAMERHIERLQAKLPPMRDEFPPVPREG